MTTHNVDDQPIFFVVAMAADPVHVGAGGARLDQVDLPIMRDPVTKVPKIPGSSLAGVYRSYVALAWEEAGVKPKKNGRQRPYFPDCAGPSEGDPREQKGHCGEADCPVCTVFGFARGRGAGFAGLAAFTDAHVLLFPVATRMGPLWITCPDALRLVGVETKSDLNNYLYLKPPAGNGKDGPRKLNLGWLLLEIADLKEALSGDPGDESSKESAAERFPKLFERFELPKYICSRIGILSDKLFSHVVNSSLEVRTSLSIDPSTGAAQEGNLFTYEALPRGTVLLWKVICKNPRHFKVNGNELNLPSPPGDSADGKVDGPRSVFALTKMAHPYLEILGIGGMGTRGMGRLKVRFPDRTPSSDQQNGSSNGYGGKGA